MKEIKKFKKLKIVSPYVSFVCIVYFCCKKGQGEVRRD